MNTITFKRILELYPDVRSYFSTIIIGDVSGLDIINFELSSDNFASMIRGNSVSELRDLMAVIKRKITIDDVDYSSVKDFAENFSIPDGEKRFFPFNQSEVFKKIHDCNIIGMIATKMLENNCEVMQKMSNQVFDRSSLTIIERTGSAGLSIEEVKKDFSSMVKEYTEKSESFKIPKMVDLYSKFKGQDKDLDKTLIDMVLPA